MNAKIRLGIVGGGASSMIGILHRVAAYMFEQYEIVGGVFSTRFEDSLEFGLELGISSRVYRDVDELIREEIRIPERDRMQVIAVLTPNHLHYSMAKRLVENGFHVICEKPLSTTYEEALELKRTQELTNTVFAVTYTYTGYPMVRQMRQMVAEGVLGKIQKIDIQYYQGWINPVIHNEEARASTWRLDPEKAGISCCMGDIGTHAFDMLEYISGLRVTEVLADLNFLYAENTMDLDGTVMLRCDDGTKGLIRASQIATGEENDLEVRIYGAKAGIFWRQENPNELYLMEDGAPKRLLKPGHTYNSSLSLDGTKLPPGHPEGIFDAMGNIYKGVARAVRKQEYDPGEFPGIEAGVRGMQFIEQVIDSHRSGNVWKKLV